MSSNITLPSFEKVKNKWGPDKVISFLESNQETLFLEDGDIKPFRDNRVPGSAFLRLNVDKLIAHPYNLHGGPAETIAELIEKIKGEEQVSRTSSVFPEDTIDKINIMYKHMTEEKVEVISLSTVNTKKFQAFLKFTGITIEYVKFTGNLPKKDIEPYEWSDYAENHLVQREEILKYFNKHLSPKLPTDIIILDVANDKDFLNIYDSSLLPFDIRGGTDLALVEEGYIKCKITKAGIRAVFEFKKVVEEHNAYQTILEMVAADLYVNDKIKVFGVLTDLKSLWNIYWVANEKRIKAVTFSHRLKALEFIAQMASDLNGHSKTVHMLGLPRIERIKVQQLFNESAPDEDRMKDFYEEMNEDEIRRHEARKVGNFFFVINLASFITIFINQFIESADLINQEMPLNRSNVPKNILVTSLIGKMINTFNEDGYFKLMTTIKGAAVQSYLSYYKIYEQVAKEINADLF
ncbi:3819_t:CDS:2, partial [Cetraspora pellucida]